MDRSNIDQRFSSKIRIGIFVGFTLIIIIILIFLPRIPQDLHYHNFADQRTILGIPNFFDVLSNLPFLLAGLLGIEFLFRSKTETLPTLFIDNNERWAYLIFFIGVALTSIGSSYYHLLPNNERLLWDRLPMTLAFMSFFSITISERFNIKVGQWLLIPLLIVGVGSVIYWHWSELNGRGDLRPYIMVQFYTMAAILLIGILNSSIYKRGKDLFIVIALYALAKILELLDKQIFGLVQVVSGHTLKHIVSAIAAYWILRMLKKRIENEGHW
jgi:hypothetical protein